MKVHHRHSIRYLLEKTLALLEKFQCQKLVGTPLVLGRGELLRKLRELEGEFPIYARSGSRGKPSDPSDL